MPFRQLHQGYRPPKINSPKQVVRRITDEQLQVAKSMREDGRTYRYIAEHLGFSPGSVWHAVNKKPRVQAIREKIEENKEMTRLYKSGLSSFAIADIMGMSQRNAWLRLTTHNGVKSLKEIGRDEHCI